MTRLEASDGGSTARGVYSQDSLLALFSTDAQPARLKSLAELAPLFYSFAGEQKSLLFVNLVARYAGYTNGYAGSDFLDVVKLMQRAPGETVAEDDMWIVDSNVAKNWVRDNFIPRNLVERHEADIAHGNRAWYTLAGIEANATDDKRAYLHDAFSLAGNMLLISEELEDVSLAEFFSMGDTTADRHGTRRRIEIATEVVRLWGEKSELDEEVTAENILDSLRMLDQRWKSDDVTRVLGTMSTLGLLEYRPRIAKGPMMFYTLPIGQEQPQRPTIDASNEDERQFVESAFDVLTEHQGEYMSLQQIYDLVYERSQHEQSLRAKRLDRQSDVTLEDYIHRRIIKTISPYLSEWHRQGLIKQRRAAAITLTNYQHQRLKRVTDRLAGFINNDQQIIREGVEKAISIVQTEDKDDQHKQQSARQTREFMAKARDSSKNFSQETRERIKTNILSLIARNQGIGTADIVRELKGMNGLLRRVPLSNSTLRSYIRNFLNEGRITIAHPRRSTEIYRLAATHLQNASFFAEKGQQIAPEYMEEFLNFALQQGVIISTDGFPVAIFDAAKRQFVLLTTSQDTIDALRRVILSLQEKRAPISFERSGRYSFLMVKGAEARGEMSRHGNVYEIGHRNPNFITLRSALVSALERAARSVGKSLNLDEVVGNILSKI